MLRRPERNPWEFCFSAILAASVWSTALGLRELPDSLAKLPGYLGRGSAIMLLIGCLLVCVGILFWDRDTGLLLEQFGCALSFFGLLVYAIALTNNPSQMSNPAIAVGSCAGAAVGAAIRFGQIQLYIRRRKREIGKTTEVHNAP